MAFPGWLLTFKLFGNIWIWDTEWKVCICSGIIWRKKLLPDVFGKKMLLKCKVSLCCAASQVLRKCLGAGESEAAAVGELWVQMCLQMCICCGEWCSLWLVRVSHCFFSYQPSHSVPHAEYFFQMWKCLTKAGLCGTGEQRGWGWGAVLHGYHS